MSGTSGISNSFLAPSLVVKSDHSVQRKSHGDKYERFLLSQVSLGIFERDFYKPSRKLFSLGDREQDDLDIAAANAQEKPGRLFANCMSKAICTRCRSWSKIISTERYSVLRSLNSSSAHMIGFVFFSMFDPCLMASCCRTWISSAAISEQKWATTYSQHLSLDEWIDPPTAGLLLSHLAKDIARCQPLRFDLFEF